MAASYVFLARAIWLIMRDLRRAALLGCSAPFAAALSRAMAALLTACSAASRSPEAMCPLALLTNVLAREVSGWLCSRFRLATRSDLAAGNSVTPDRIVVHVLILARQPMRFEMGARRGCCTSLVGGHFTLTLTLSLRELKGVGIYPHPNPLPEGEGACWLVFILGCTHLPTLVSPEGEGISGPAARRRLS